MIILEIMLALVLVILLIYVGLPVLEEKATAGGTTLVESNREDRIHTGRYIELVDRASVAVDYMYQFLGSHPLVKKVDVLDDMYIEVWKALDAFRDEASRLEYGSNGPGHTWLGREGF